MDTYDLSIYKGETFTMSLVVHDISGAVLDLSGYQVSGYLKTKYSDTQKLADLNAYVLDGPNGIISVNMTASVTETLPVNYAFYDIEMRNTGDNSVTKVLGGKAAIYPEVTF